MKKYQKEKKKKEKRKKKRKEKKNNIGKTNAAIGLPFQENLKI